MAVARRGLMLAAGVLLLLAPTRAWAGAPTDRLKAEIDRVLEVLEDPELKKPGKVRERRAAVRRISYLGETLDGDQAMVHTKLVTKGGSEIPVDYRMLRRGDRWLVYDVVIEGISLIANYRAQFNKIITTASYQELVRRMKTKQDEFVHQERPASQR